MENVIAFEIARALVEKFGGDSLGEMRGNYDNYLEAGAEDWDVTDARGVQCWLAGVSKGAAGAIV